MRYTHLRILSSAALVGLVLAACSGNQELVPGTAPKKALDFSANKPKQVTVGPEDTVYGIAYEHGISTKSLVVLNDIPSPYELRTGQVLELPQPNEHIVTAGETLPEIAQIYGVNVDALARENEIMTTATLSPRQRLLIPSADTEPVVTPAAPVVMAESLAPLAIASKPLDDPQPKTAALPNDLAKELAEERGEPSEEDRTAVGALPLATTAAATGVAMTSAPAKAAGVPPEPTPPVVETAASAPADPVSEAPTSEAVATPTADFIWPAQGEVISKFGAKGGKTKNDGINIQVPEGTAVMASADGEVLYAGNELKGFGNLVLIKHAGGLKTAYAHNSKLLVKKGDIVKQGQEIAKSGKTGDVKTPQIHFEIREGTQAVDPMTKL